MCFYPRFFSGGSGRTWHAPMTTAPGAMMKEQKQRGERQKRSRGGPKEQPLLSEQKQKQPRDVRKKIWQRGDPKKNQHGA